MSNVACIDGVRVSETILGMMKIHPTMARLYEAAALKGLSGQSEVARALNMSPQRLNNWEARGISQQGATKAQSELGINATWLLTGDGPAELKSAVTEPSHTSQYVPLDPVTLVEAVKLVQKVWMVKEKEELEVEDLVDDCTYLAFAYSFLTKRNFQSLSIQTDSVIVDFSKYVRAQESKSGERLGANAGGHRKSSRKKASEA